MPSRASSRYAGFTLVELVVVVAIIIALSAWGVPALAIQARDRALYNSGLQVQQDLRLAQQTAISTRVPGLVTFDTDAGTYAYSYKGSNRTRKLRQDIVLSLPSFPSGITALRFDAFGRPSYGNGGSLIGDGASIVFANRAGDKKVTVWVSRVMGRCSLVWTKP